MIIKGVEIVCIDFIGSVLCRGYELRDVECVATFSMYGWTFIVHRDLEDSDYFNVTEASSGCYVMDYIYDDFKEAIEHAIERINSRHLEIHTRSSSIKVKSKKDLFKRNIILSTNELNLLWNL